MKLYIPTCTLNFNNILSTESISPSDYYSKRGFGNKRFYTVPANEKEGMVVLYSKFPRADVNDSDLENYPMVIEIDTRDYPDYVFEKIHEYNGVEIFASFHTIYLNPFHSFFYFNSYAELQSVLTKAEQSLENKFGKLYRNNLLVKQGKQKSFMETFKDSFRRTKEDEFEWSSAYCQFELPNKESDYAYDVWVDRVKGFLYCYLIGANQSPSHETARLKALARNLKNTLSAVFNSPDKRPTQRQDEALVNDIKEFNRVYKIKNEDYQQNWQTVKNKLENNPLELDIHKCLDLLKAWNLYDAFCMQLRLKAVYDAGELWSCLEDSNADTYRNALQNLENAVKKVEAKDLAEIEKYKISELLGIDEKHKIQIKDSTYHTQFYQKLIESQIDGDYQRIMKENEVEEGVAQAYNGGKILKGIMGDAWDNSKVSGYMNDLLRYFQENKPLDLFAIDSIVISSFAAFCQKGDNIDRLSEFLVQNGFSNYRLALGLYGATRGFASLPKTFTSILIDSDKQYFRTVYEDIYQMIFNIPLTDTCFPQKDEERWNKSDTSKDETNTTIDKKEKSEDKQYPTACATSLSEPNTQEYHNLKIFMSILSCFPGIKKANAYKRFQAAGFDKDEKEYLLNEFRSKIFSKLDKKTSPKILEKINLCISLEGLHKNKSAYSRLLDELIDSSDPIYMKISNLSFLLQSRAEKISNGTNERKRFASLRDNCKLKPVTRSSGLFVDDVNAANYLLTKTYLSVDTRKLLSEKVHEFQSDYAPGGYYYGKPENSRSNENTIRHFINKCTFQKGNMQPWIHPSGENKQLLERLRQDLQDRYER